MGSFENVFLVLHSLFNILNFVKGLKGLLLFYWQFSGPFSLAPILSDSLSDFHVGKNDTFWGYLKHRMLGCLLLRYFSASLV